MPRKYERKTDRESWDEEKMALAIKAVKSKYMDSLKSATAFSVAKTTLKNMVKKKNQNKCAEGTRSC